MAKCDEGYLCVVCGAEVKRIDQSELYLRYVVGWIDDNKLNRLPERHLACNPSLAQFIDDPTFAGLPVAPEMQKSQLDSQFCDQRERLLTAGYRRLQELQKRRSGVRIEDYPLPAEVLQELETGAKADG